MNSPARPLLLLRADASAAQGSGHVMRCLALGAAWRSAGGRVEFACAECPSALAQRIAGADARLNWVDTAPGTVEDAQATSKLASSMRAAWMAADNYAFGAEWQRIVRQAGTTMLVFDDYGHAERWHADALLNQNAHALPESYEKVAPGVELLLGSRFLLLRPEFGAWRAWNRPADRKTRSLLVTLGGTDPRNVTLRILEHLDLAEGWMARVIAGGSNPHVAELERFCSSHPQFSFQHDPPDMAKLMAESDLGIVAGGGTAWEAAFMGLPSVIVRLAENQRAVAGALAAAGAGVDIGEELAAIPTQISQLAADREGRAQMSARGRSLIDGRGAERVVLALRAALVSLQRAGPENSLQIWEWANDAEVRLRSFNSEPIGWDTHLRWYESLLSDSSAALLVAKDQDGAPLGQVRFVPGSEGATISVSVAPAARGRGYAAPLIVAASRWWEKEHGNPLIHAFIKPDNEASLSAFRRAGFQAEASSEVRGQAALILTRQHDPLRADCAPGSATVSGPTT